MFDCCCTGDDSDWPEFFREKIVVAKKEYKCIECGEKISIGEKYEYVVGRWPDGFDVIRTCHICSKIRKELFCSWTYGALKDDLQECYDLEL